MKYSIGKFCMIASFVIDKLRFFFHIRQVQAVHGAGAGDIEHALIDWRAVFLCHRLLPDQGRLVDLLVHVDLFDVVHAVLFSWR
jgi:hypothetical protein